MVYGACRTVRTCPTGAEHGLGSGVGSRRARLDQAAQGRRRVGERRYSGDEVGGGLSERGVVC